MENREKKIYIATIVGAIGNAALLAFKFIAGIVGHSSAMIADAVHSASDFITDIIVLVFVKISGKPRDIDHKYGHGKYETLATAIIGLMLLGVGLGIMWSGGEKIWMRLQGKELELPGTIALIAALVSIAVKEGLYQYTVRVGRKLKSQVVVANAWHHRSDAFSSIATAVGIGGALLFGKNWAVLDPIAAVLVSFLIVKAAFGLFIPSINELLEKSLPQDLEKKIIETIQSVPEASDVHNLRTRRIGPVSSVEFHVRMDGDMTVSQSHAITRQIESRLRQLLGPETLITVHVEPKSPSPKPDPPHKGFI